MPGRIVVAVHVGESVLRSELVRVRARFAEIVAVQDDICAELAAGRGFDREQLSGGRAPASELLGR